jgi:hypothetical protein
MADESGSDNTYMNIIIFILITILFFAYGKPKPTIDTLSNPASPYKSYGIYFMAVLVFQLAINMSALENKCGGGWTANLGYAVLITLGPWIAMFGILIAVMINFPGMKSAFSDVIGYYAVSNSANKLLAELLVDTDVNDKIKQASDGTDETKQQAMQDAAEAVMKMVGNISILINQIVPSNFMSYWKTLIPLMKNPQAADLPEKQQALLDIVVLRDNIGEACWYIYTAILLISIIGYKIVNKSCEVDPKVANARYDEYLDKQQAMDDAKAIANSIPYTLG